MMIHDYDDEQTLDDEEAMSNGESVINELDDLQKEGEMPMEELLAMYGLGRESEEPGEGSGAGGASNANGSCEEEAAAGAAPQTAAEADGTQGESMETSDQDKSNSEHESGLPSQMTRLLTGADLMEVSTDEDEDEDEDYDPENDEDWKKSIQIGSDYQAVVPDGLETYDNGPAYEEDDRCLWDPTALSDPEIERYLGEVQLHDLTNAQGVHAIPTGSHVRDDEQALYLLHNCEHNLEEALRRHKMQSVPPSDPMTLWSEEECRNFEIGLRTYGKDFFLNQQHKVRTRSVKELVQFYYLWKKTERHDAYAARTRLEKKRYVLHPGITDYMDRFLDENDGPTESHEQLNSPSIHSLLYGDPKRHEGGRSSEDLSAALEIVQKVASSSTVDLLLPGKFREDVQAMVLGSFATDSEISKGPDRYVDDEQNFAAAPTFSSEHLDNQEPKLTRLPSGDSAEDDRRLSPTSEASLCERLNKSGEQSGFATNEVLDLDGVLEIESNDDIGLPLKKPRLELSDAETAKFLAPGACVLHDVSASIAGESKSAETENLGFSSDCLSPVLDVNLTSTKLGLGALIPSSSSDIDCCLPALDSNSGSFVATDFGSVSMTDAPARTGSILSSSFMACSEAGGYCPDSGSISSASRSVGLTFDSFPAASDTLSIALDSLTPNLECLDNVAPSLDSLALDPTLQRLTSLDSIEPSLPALDAFPSSIDNYTSVLEGQGNALENLSMDSLTSMLQGYNPSIAGSDGAGQVMSTSSDISNSGAGNSGSEKFSAISAAEIPVDGGSSVAVPASNPSTVEATVFETNKEITSHSNVANNLAGSDACVSTCIASEADDVGSPASEMTKSSGGRNVAGPSVDESDQVGSCEYLETSETTSNSNTVAHTTPAQPKVSEAENLSGVETANIDINAKAMSSSGSRKTLDAEPDSLSIPKRDVSSGCLSGHKLTNSDDGGVADTGSTEGLTGRSDSALST